MKILIFTEGTILMHNSGEAVPREQRVKQVKDQLLEIHDYRNYIPIGNSVEKLEKWVNNGAEIYYLTSRIKKEEVEAIKSVLNKYKFPKGMVLYRNEGQEYKDVAEDLMPEILIEDDCESIGGKTEMTYPSMSQEAKSKVRSISVKEFGGIDHLPDSLQTTRRTN